MQILIGLAIIGFFVLGVSFLIKDNSLIPPKKGVCKDMTGDAYNFVIIPAVLGYKKGAVARSTIELFTHPIQYTRFNLSTFPASGGGKELSIDLTKAFPKVVDLIS